MLKAVTFDLWGTLIKDRPGSVGRSKSERIRKIDEALRGAQLAVGEQGVASAYEALGEEIQAIWKTTRDLGAREQVELLLDILAVEKGAVRSAALIDRLVEAYSFPILSELPLAMEGATDILPALEARGLRLALICNTGRTPGKVLRIILERLGLAQHLRVMTFSDEVGLRKPRPEIFEQTLAAIGVRPADALHIGDTPAADYEGAIGIGMSAAHLCHPLGADPCPGDRETIYSLSELLTLVGADALRVH